MLYAKTSLLPKEKIIYYSKPHYIIFYPLFFWIAIGTWVLCSDHKGLLFDQLLTLMYLFGILALLIGVFSFINSLIIVLNM
jgi:hypothetical protein